MIRRVRNLQPGQVFILKRTGERYVFIRRCHETPGGTRHVVRKIGCGRESSLHHSCHVEWKGDYDAHVLTQWLGLGSDPRAVHEVELVLLSQWAEREGIRA